MNNLSKKPPKRLHPSEHSAKNERGTRRATENDRLVSVLRAAEERREIRRKLTFGIYALKTKDSIFGLLFVGVNDELALSANKEILPLANLYRIGDYCRLDAKITVYKTPKIILDK